MIRTDLALRRSRRATIAAVVVATCATTLSGAITGPASAAGLTASTTLLSARISDDAQRVTATVTVRMGTNTNGFGITPTGTVHFSDNLGDNLGSVAVPSCLLKPCTTSYVIPTDRFSSGVTRLTATYSGDTILKPSAAGVALGLSRCDGTCEADVFAGNADMEVESDSDTGYIVANFGGAGLPCGVNGGGPIGHVTSYNLGADKEIYYMLVGPGAAAYANLALDGQEWFCYASPVEFDAWSQDGVSTDFPPNGSSFGTFGPAPQMGGPNYNGLYVGLLGDCEEGDNGPCIESYSLYQNSDHGNQWELSVDLVTPPGDPYLGGLKLAAPKIGHS